MVNGNLALDLIQISEHHFEEQINLEEFFASTVKVIQDSQSVNKFYQIYELGKSQVEEEDAFWISYSRDDHEYSQGSAKAVGYYSQGLNQKSIIQIDFITYGQDQMTSFCSFNEVLKSIRLKKRK